MLSAAEIVEIAALALHENGDNMDDYWNRKGQSPKAFRVAIDFMEKDLTPEFEAALIIGFELGTQVTASTTTFSEN